MRGATNDNDTWTSIGLHAALILNRLTNKRQLSDAEHLPEGDEPKQQNDYENASEEHHEEHERRKLWVIR